MNKPILAAALALLLPLTAQAQVFEVIHPDVEEGGYEFELLNTVVADGIGVGEERSVHEIALGYAPVSFWKTTVAFEVATVRGESSVFEALEWENVFLFPLGGHDHDHDHDHDHGSSDFGLEALGLYAALEIPREGGLSSGGASIGPVAELALGPVHSVANLFVEVPFVDGEDPGLAYALSAAVPVFETETAEFEAGFEAHGGVEGLFGSNTTPLGQNSHVVGPALYAGFDIGEGREIEPRLAVLFGLTDGAPDAAVSFNVEFKY